MLLLNASIALFSAGIGAGVVTLAAAIGIGKIGVAAMEAIARQPEASNKMAIGKNLFIQAATDGLLTVYRPILTGLPAQPRRQRS